MVCCSKGPSQRGRSNPPGVTTPLSPSAAEGHQLPALSCQPFPGTASVAQSPLLKVMPLPQAAGGPGRVGVGVHKPGPFALRFQAPHTPKAVHEPGAPRPRVPNRGLLRCQPNFSLCPILLPSLPRPEQRWMPRHSSQTSCPQISTQSLLPGDVACQHPKLLLALPSQFLTPSLCTGPSVSPIGPGAPGRWGLGRLFTGVSPPSGPGSDSRKGDRRAGLGAGGPEEAPSKTDPRDGSEMDGE